MSEQKFRLGTETTWGRTSCGYGVGIEQTHCNEPSTTHVLWLPELGTSGTCDEHLRFIEGNADREYETHTFGPNCGMPGTLWQHPYEDEDEGYCLFPGPDDVSLIAEEPVPAMAITTPTDERTDDDE